MQLKRIRLELARNHDFPEGSARHGYEFVAPLDEAGHIDADGWRHHKAVCTVHRFWGDAEQEDGRLRHTKGRRWIFDYDPDRDDDDEPLFNLDRHEMKVGEYLTVTEHDGERHTFKIVSITPEAG